MFMAEANVLAVAYHTVDPRRGKGWVHSGLRVSRTGGSAVEDRCGRRRRDELGAGQLLQARHSADMVEVLMAVEQVADVAQVEAKPADVGGDQVGAHLGPGVDEDVPGVAGDEDRRNPASADEIGIGMDPHRRRRLVPLVIFLAARGEQRAVRFDRSARTLHLSWLLQRDRERDDLRQREGGEASEHSWRR